MVTSTRDTHPTHLGRDIRRFGLFRPTWSKLLGDAKVARQHVSRPGFGTASLRNGPTAVLPCGNNASSRGDGSPGVVGACGLRAGELATSVVAGCSATGRAGQDRSSGTALLRCHPPAYRSHGLHRSSDKFSTSRSSGRSPASCRRPVAGRAHPVARRAIASVAGGRSGQRCTAGQAHVSTDRCERAGMPMLLRARFGGFQSR